MNNKIIMSILGIAIGIILVGSVLAPVISDAQKNAGEYVEYINNAPLQKISESSEEVVVEYSAANKTMTVNGVPHSTALSRTVWISADSLTLAQNNGGSGIYLSTSNGTYDGHALAQDFKVVLSNGTYTIQYLSNIHTGSYSWAYIYNPAGDHVAISGANVYFNTPEDLIASGMYTTGELDTYYSLYNGVLSIANPDYQGTISYTMELVEGTTDIYLGTAQVEITDGETTESFTPYLIGVYEKVTGHESKGGAYSLYGVIPALVILALLISAIPLVRARD